MKCFECKEGEVEIELFKIDDNTPFEIDISEFPNNLQYHEFTKKLNELKLKCTLTCKNHECGGIFIYSSFNQKVETLCPYCNKKVLCSILSQSVAPQIFLRCELEQHVFSFNFVNSFNLDNNQ